ncbi:ketoacyl-synthetase C-terminal extension domain-containing protein, partial [Streptomyces sp. NRRL WC-3549]|uniref:ketoacyl-synthetase C-terminal extension domain-containing protein n=1 Tax=Streptomyces sp. NRRL WC-3549 TaxID=1463925 RepID=UPI0004C695C4
KPSSQVDWSAGSVELLTEQVAWPETGEARRAAVSSFGISGTNAHVILEQAPVDADVATQADEVSPLGGAVLPFVLSGKSEGALRDQAARLSEMLAAGPKAAPGGIGLSLAMSRSRFEHRAVIVAADSDELVAELAALAGELPGP